MNIAAALRKALQKEGMHDSDRTGAGGLDFPSWKDVKINSDVAAVNLI